ncbi:MAG: hypothetical protein GY769_00895, partial [bacterium]|nr:hypothetical protein [bacterium]
MAATGLDKDSVMRAYEDVKQGRAAATPEERKVAVRNVSRLEKGEHNAAAVPSSPDNVFMYIALRRLAGDKDAARVSARSLRKWTQEIVTEVALTQRYWVRQRAGYTLPERCKAFVVPAEHLDVDEAMRLSLASCFVIDSSCPKEWLGPGLSEISVKASTRCLQRDGGTTPGHGSGHLLPPTPTPMIQDGEAHSDSEPADSLADSASKRARVRPAPGQEADDAAAAEAASTESALPWRGRAAL